jgi:hypothetical protein
LNILKKIPEDVWKKWCRGFGGGGKNINAFAGKYQTRWERTRCAGSGEKFTFVRWKKVVLCEKNIKALQEKNTAGSAENKLQKKCSKIVPDELEKKSASLH